MIAINRIFFLSCFIIGMDAASFAQNDSAEFKLLKPRELKSFGRNAMIQGDYIAAAGYLERYMKLRPDDYKAAFKLAESYRLNRDYSTALEWYEKSYELSGKSYPPALYYDALMLKMNGNCDKAKQKFTAFRQQAGSDDLSKALKKQLKYEILGCDSVVPRTQKKIAITHIDTSINKVHVEAAPFYLNDSTIIYSALRTNKREYIIEEDTSNIPVRKLYKAIRKNGEWQYAGELEGPFNTLGQNISGGAFSADGERFYFSRCEKNWKDKMICAIYVSYYENGAWSEPVSVSKLVNNPEYTATQPSVASTSKGEEIIYFVSDRKGGKGGYDIWYFTYNAKKNVYSAPRNAGTKVNTAQDEMSPFYDQNTATLYFSSSGWPGMGGLDVFKTQGEMRKFTAHQNLGAPINSTYDDLFYTISTGREKGMLVSNRKGGVSLKNPTCCDDLYEYQRLEFINLKITGTVFGGADSTSRTPMNDASLDVYLIDDRIKEAIFVKTIPVNSNARYEFIAEPESNYKFVAKREGYLNRTTTVSTAGIKENKIIEQDLVVTKIPEVFHLENVYYETDKYALTDNSKKAIDTTLIHLLTENPEIKIEIGSHTDDQGSDSYNKNLSQKRADGVVKYLISKGINPERLVAMGYGESKPVAPNVNPDGTGNEANRAKNRRTEFRVIGKVDILIQEPAEDKEEKGEE